MSRLNIGIHENLTEDILKILFSKKIFTNIDFIDADIKFLSNITSLPYKDVLKIRDALILKNGGQILTGLELYDDLVQNIKVLPTFIKGLDEILNGGLSNTKIYEFCGYASAGKTQICLTLALNFVQYHSKSVLYIDTKRDFSAKRLQEILSSRNCTEEQTAKICHDIKIKQIANRFQLLSVLNEITNANSDISKVELVIIDSLPTIFYHKGDFNNTLTSLNHFANILRYLNVTKKICFVLTNILLRNSGSTEPNSVKNLEKPGLGYYWFSVPHFRLKVSKFQINFCQIEIIKSTDLPLGSLSCKVEIGNLGVT